LYSFEKYLSQNNFTTQWLYIHRSVLNARNWRQTALFKGIQIFSIVVDECQGTNSTVQCPSMHINVAWTTDSLLPCNIWLFSNDWNKCANRYVMCVHLNYLNSVSDNVVLICLANGVMSGHLCEVCLLFLKEIWRYCNEKLLCLFIDIDWYRTALIP
jgi:hypothetical protein